MWPRVAPLWSVYETQKTTAWRSGNDIGLINKLFCVEPG